MTGPRATAEDTFDAIAAALLPEPDVEPGTGFGPNPGLRTHGKIFAMLVGGDLVLKLPADHRRALVEAGAARAFTVGRRGMREWVRLADTDRETALRLAREARGYAG